MATCVEKKNSLEWEDLNEEGRNCLTWPEFMEWGPEVKAEIEKTSADGDLGIATTIKQIGETSFHIITEVKEGSPASQWMKQFDWITIIDKTPTTRVKESKEFKKLTKNGKIKVHLSFRRASNLLTNIKQWSREREVKIEVSPKLGFRLAHFYSKVKNDNIKDHILISKIEQGTNENSKPYKHLNRGDELLSVNGEVLTEKRLRDIYTLFLNETNTVVTLQVKMILRGKEFQEMLGKMALKYPDQIYWMHEKREITFTVSEESTGLGLRFISKCNSEREEFHIVFKVIEDKPASQENICVGSRLLSVDDQDITCLKKEKAAELMRKKEGKLKFLITTPEGIKEQPKGPRKKRHSLSRTDSESESSTWTGSSPSEGQCGSESCHRIPSCNVSDPKQSLLVAGISETTCVIAKPASPLKKHHQAAAIEEQENKAFEGSENEDPVSEFCKECILKNATKKRHRLPDDKLKWPLKNMDPVTFGVLCKELERRVAGTDTRIEFVAAHLSGFTQNIIDEIVQRYSADGGKGAGKCVLKRWMEPDPYGRTVGELLQMLKKIKRGQAVFLIEEWLLKDDWCNICGALINTYG